MKKITAIFIIATTIVAVHAQNGENYLNGRLPDNWSQEEQFQQTIPMEDTWWHSFDDSRLDSLITVAGRSNYSVLSAIENIRIAKASWRIAQSAMYPSIDLGGGWQRSKTSGNISSTGYKESWGGYFDAAVSMSWQADLFGNIYKRSQAQKQLFMASEEEYRAVMVTLCANVAKTYFSLLQSLGEMNVLQKNVDSQKEIMNLVEVRYNTGLASKLDVAQARSVYYSTLASIPAMNATIQQYRNAMAILLGEYPENFRNWPGGNITLPKHTGAVAIGVPANLLRRRPDVRAAERNVEAYASLLGAAKREWLPEFYLNASIGFAATDARKIPRSGSMTWEIAPSMQWNLFDGGSNTNSTRQAKARLEQSIIEFNSTVLTAMQEVENAISAYRYSIEQIEALRETVIQGEETLRLSLNLYKQGLTPFQNVLDAQRSLLNYQDNLVKAQGYSLITLVELYESLGGGW